MLRALGGAVESDPLAIDTETVSRGLREIAGEDSEAAKMRRRTRVAVFSRIGSQELDGIHGLGPPPLYRVREAAYARLGPATLERLLRETE